MIYDNVLPPPVKPMPMGLVGLDHVLRASRLIVIAGHPGHGAETLTNNIARVAAVRNGIPTAYTGCYGLEDEVMIRILAAEAGVFSSRITSGATNEQETARIASATARIQTAPLFLNCLNHYLDHVANHIANTRARLAVIDGAHLLLDAQPYEDPQDRADWQSRELKLLANDLRIPVVVSVPLMEHPERAGGGLLTDFGTRYSFAQHADVVLMTYRPELGGDTQRGSEIEITIAKHRNGPVDKVTAWYQSSFERVVDFPF